MARFPEGEAEIAALALRIISGIESAGEEFGSPPISADTLRASLDAYNVAKDAIVSAETAAQARYAVKQEALDELEDGMKANLRFAEIVYRHDPERLGLFGWGPRRADSSLEVPGQVRSLEVIGEGSFGVVYLCHDQSLDRPVALKKLKPDPLVARRYKKYRAMGVFSDR